MKFIPIIFMQSRNLVEEAGIDAVDGVIGYCMPPKINLCFQHNCRRITEHILFSFPNQAKEPNRQSIHIDENHESI